jgi:hypothetical protein
MNAARRQDILREQAQHFRRLEGVQLWERRGLPEFIDVVVCASVACIRLRDEAHDELPNTGGAQRRSIRKQFSQENEKLSDPGEG